MENIKLSVIIPLYNGKKYIKETVNSILDIKCSKEIIIIDDGSTEAGGGKSYCEKIWKTNGDIKLYSKSNSGIVDTRNFGLSLAKGEYILFSDQDDIVYSQIIDKTIEFMDKNELDGVLWSTVRLLDGGQTIECDTVGEDGIVYREEIINSFIPCVLLPKKNNRVSAFGHVWAGIYKREIVEKAEIRFKRFVDIEDDYLFVFDFLNVAYKIGLIHDVGYAWRYNLNSETFRLKYIDNYLFKCILLTDYLSQEIEKFGYSEEIINRHKQFRIQNNLVMAVENSFTYMNKSKADKNKIKDFYKKNRSYFKSKSICDYKNRRKRIYKCLELGLFDIATYYVYIDSLYRKAQSLFRRCCKV